jgi:ornithine decarboxylase
VTAGALRRLAQRHGTPLLVIDFEAIRARYRAQRVPAGRCIHTHPIKSQADIAAALRFGIRRFVFDNPDELRKFVPYRSRAELLLRVSFRNPTAVVDLSRKFGCEPTAARTLLDLARDIGVRVCGLSFHVGSPVADPGRYVDAIDACREIIVETRRDGHVLDMLDIGGGFPVAYAGKLPGIREFCRPIRRELGTLPPGTRVIAEPGRTRWIRCSGVVRGTPAFSPARPATAST